MTSIDELVSTGVIPDRVSRPRGSHKTGREFHWDGSSGYIETEALDEEPKTWDEFIKDAGLDPDEVEVIGPVQFRGWDAAIGNGKTKRMRHYKITVQRKTKGLDIDRLVDAAREDFTAPAVVTNSTRAYVVALGDLQLGKVDGDGTEGVIKRFLEKTESAVERYRREFSGSVAYIVHLGDCIEGFMSQGGANAWRTTLTTTEQVRLYRRLAMEQIKAFAKVAPEVVVVGIPGNHDEAHRPLHSYSDSWAIEAMVTIRDALELAGSYDHVKIHVPERDELALTLDVCGTIITMVHGHQFGSGVESWKKWWAGNSFGRQDAGDADILLAAHKHHLTIVQDGPRAFIQVPALESESTWWRHRTGTPGNPGIVTMCVGDGKWERIEII